MSVLIGLATACCDSVTNVAAVDAALELVLGEVADPTAFLSSLGLFLLIMCNGRHAVLSILRKIRGSEADILRAGIAFDFDLDEPRWARGYFHSLIHSLVALGADTTLTGNEGANFLSSFMVNYRSIFCFSDPPWALSEILRTLVALDVDLHHCDESGQTPSVHARREDCWRDWCQALEANGRSIEEVLAAEGNSRLLQEDWWRSSERYRRRKQRHLRRI